MRFLLCNVRAQIHGRVITSCFCKSHCGSSYVSAADEAATVVVRLANSVTAAEIEDPEEYTDILEDMKEECIKVRNLPSHDDDRGFPYKPTARASHGT